MPRLAVKGRQTGCCLSRSRVCVMEMFSGGQTLELKLHARPRRFCRCVVGAKQSDAICRVFHCVWWKNCFFLDHLSSIRNAPRHQSCGTVEVSQSEQSRVYAEAIISQGCIYMQSLRHEEVCTRTVPTPSLPRHTHPFSVSLFCCFEFSSEDNVKLGHKTGEKEEKQVVLSGLFLCANAEMAESNGKLLVVCLAGPHVSISREAADGHGQDLGRPVRAT
ncbi:uncharacterized protein J3D65DRAFT_459695 [Phyllosticta citribraziliensis]|uniref:Uncharacterized protein n=1 Tax=Phyllosticta citribraziliensis TaxID=989973 RepID=A0ABR1LJF1_9PEZI